MAITRSKSKQNSEQSEEQKQAQLKQRVDELAAKSNLTIFFRDDEGIELAPYLEQSSVKQLLYNKRILYVLRANMDVNVLKFGIAGARHGGSSGWGRLHQYVNTYGEKGPYDCNGVTLYLLVGTEYKSTVQPENALVTRKELKLKRELKGDLIKGRGTERVTTNYYKVLENIFDNTNMTSEDIETKVRESARIQQGELQAADRVVRITDDWTRGRGKTRYLTEWNRPYIDKKTGEKDYTTWETYNKLITYTNGEQAVEEYEDEHPDKTFVH